MVGKGERDWSPERVTAEAVGRWGVSAGSRRIRKSIVYAQGKENEVEIFSLLFLSFFVFFFLTERKFPIFEGFEILGVDQLAPTLGQYDGRVCPNR